MAAGLGFKDFTTGEVLTAADVDGYLMQGVWVFASAAARTSAVTSPQEGNMSYLKDTNSLEYYSGSAWTAVAGGSTPTFVGVALSDANQQTIANNTITVLTWDTEQFDTDAFHSTSSNTGRITIPAGKNGKYLLIGQTTFAANASGDRELYLRKNGSTIKTVYTPATATVFPLLSFSAILDLTATDYVEMAVNQTSGGNLTAYKGTAGYGWFNAQYLGA